ncbi:Spore germination protein YndE [Clostridium sp. N3C]|uniref:GerAB/ArcD/ProY family transporter n=1 Tax=Clostridium sp. N3C TaxID=1776758 RepID=UPI00092DF554|nr:endospore germination permease [Clostridium sp. N3C]SCN21550.1 Spore germination protein YndE [Clostridium sp. N3C]
MKTVGKDEITYQEYTYIIVGAIFGVGILALPNRLAEVSRQDAWISAAVGGIYPLYIALLTILITKKFPNDNILSISKKVFGNFFGSILNLLFSAHFFVNLIGITTGAMSLSILYIVSFLSVFKISIVVLILAVYGSLLGLKVIGRVNEFMYYLKFILLLIPLVALKDGSMLNVSPIFGSGIKKIIDGSVRSIFAYSGVEVMLLFYPNVKDKDKVFINKATLKSVFVMIVIYTYFTFLTIYFVGPTIVTRSYFAVMLLNEAINLPFINSFRFFFMFIWIMIVFKTIITNYYSCSYIISNFSKKLDIRKICLLLFFLMIFAISIVHDEAARRAFLNKTINYTLVYNLIYVTIITIIIYFKKGDKNENL